MQRIPLALAGALVALTLATPSHSTLNACSAGKKKCVAKKAGAILTCHSRNDKPPGLPPGHFATCIQKAKDRFDGGANPARGCFAKLEAKYPGGCLTSADTAAIEAKVDAFVDDVVCELDAGSGSCHATPTPTPTPTATPFGTCVPGSIESYVALGSEGCTIGFYLFYNVTYSGTSGGGATPPAVTVDPVQDNTTLRGGTSISGLSLLAAWSVTDGETVGYDFSVSIAALPPSPGIPAGVAAYGGDPFPYTFVPPNTFGLISYAFMDGDGYTITGSNVFTDLQASGSDGLGGGANFFTPWLPQSVTLSFSQVFAAGAGGLVQVQEQVTGVQDYSP